MLAYDGDAQFVTRRLPSTSWVRQHESSNADRLGMHRQLIGDEAIYTNRDQVWIQQLLLQVYE